MDKQKYYITTAIAYTSGKPHIGNTYEVVLADAIARYKRQSSGCKGRIYGSYQRLSATGGISGRTDKRNSNGTERGTS